MFTSISNTIKLHERLILIVLFLVTVVYLGHKYLVYAADTAKLNADTAVQTLAKQTADNKALADESKQREAQYVSLVTTLAAENAQVLSAMAQRTQATVVQQKVDKTLPLPELANRWAALGNFSPAEITNQPTGLLVSDAASRTTVQNLEEIPTLTQNLADQKKIADAKDTQLASLTGVNNGLVDQVSGLTLQAKDSEKACKAEITSVKASARKSKWKWFGVGVGIGAGIVTKFAFF